MRESWISSLVFSEWSLGERVSNVIDRFRVENRVS
jgi:hypothetical protein